MPLRLADEATYELVTVSGWFSCMPGPLSRSVRVQVSYPSDVTLDASCVRHDMLELSGGALGTTSTRISSTGGAGPGVDGFDWLMPPSPATTFGLVAREWTSDIAAWIVELAIEGCRRQGLEARVAVTVDSEGT